MVPTPGLASKLPVPFEENKLTALVIGAFGDALSVKVIGGIIVVCIEAGIITETEMLTGTFCCNDAIWQLTVFEIKEHPGDSVP